MNYFKNFNSSIDLFFLKSLNKNNNERILHPKVAELLETDNDLRIKFIQKGSFVEYEVIKIIWQEILDLLEQPIRPRIE